MNCASHHRVTKTMMQRGSSQPPAVSLPPGSVQRLRFPQSSAHLLNRYFATDPSPQKEHLLQLAAATGATERQIRIWFQNKRQRLRVRGRKQAQQEDDPQYSQQQPTQELLHLPQHSQQQQTHPRSHHQTQKQIDTFFRHVFAIVHAPLQIHAQHGTQRQSNQDEELPEAEEAPQASGIHCREDQSEQGCQEGRLRLRDRLFD